MPLLVSDVTEALDNAVLKVVDGDLVHLPSEGQHAKMPASVNLHGAPEPIETPLSHHVVNLPFDGAVVGGAAGEEHWHKVLAVHCPERGSTVVAAVV